MNILSQCFTKEDTWSGSGLMTSQERFTANVATIIVIVRIIAVVTIFVAVLVVEMLLLVLLVRTKLFLLT